MKIRGVRHKGLRAFLKDGDTSGISPDRLKRIGVILTALRHTTRIEDVESLPGWRIHPLTGNRAGTWSVSISANWRITFRIEEGVIVALDLEDYH
jgi:proteic killer suppression protein